MFVPEGKKGKRCCGVLLGAPIYTHTHYIHTHIYICIYIHLSGMFVPEGKKGNRCCGVLLGTSFNRQHKPSLAVRYLEKKTRRFFLFFLCPSPFCFPGFTRG